MCIPKRTDRVGALCALACESLKASTAALQTPKNLLLVLASFFKIISTCLPVPFQLGIGYLWSLGTLGYGQGTGSYILVTVLDPRLYDVSRWHESAELRSTELSRITKQLRQTNLISSAVNLQDTNTCFHSGLQCARKSSWQDEEKLPDTRPTHTRHCRNARGVSAFQHFGF